VDDRGLSEREQELWSELTGHLADVPHQALRTQRRHLAAHVAVVVALVVGSLAAVFWMPLVVCFPAACWVAALLVERHRPVERLAERIRLRMAAGHR